jgi:hypothetical protein
MTLLRWYDLLTLDHTVCRICYGAGDHGTRIISDPAIVALRASPRTRAAYISKLKAALRAHITAVHPDFLPRVRWVKDLYAYPLGSTHHNL